jgi:hypothetical protein
LFSSLVCLSLEQLPRGWQTLAPFMNKSMILHVLKQDRQRHKYCLVVKMLSPWQFSRMF